MFLCMFGIVLGIINPPTNLRAQISGAGYNASRTFTTSLSGGAQDIGLNFASHISWHQIAWTVTGAPGSCTVSVDSAPDGITWAVGGVITGQTCTSNGGSALVNTASAPPWIRLNVSALSASATIIVYYTGWAYNPNGNATPTNVAQAAGATADAKLATAIAALPAGGGVLDMGGFQGNTNWASQPTLATSNVTILIPDGVVFLPTSASIPGFITITGQNDHIKCANRSTLVMDWSAFNVTGGTASSIISVTGTAISGLTVEGCHMRGDRIAAGVANAADTGVGQQCIRVFPGAANYNQNIYIYDNYVEQCGSFGINVNASSNVYVERNDIVQTSGAGLQINSGSIASQEYRGWFVRNNTSYDDNTANLAGTAHLNLINPNFATSTVVDLQITGNDVYNDIAGGDGAGNAKICNNANSATSTGCFQGIEVNNVSDILIANNHLRNMNGEAISTVNGGGRFIIADNDCSLAGANVNTTPSTVTTAGAGCILLFYSANNITNQQVSVHDNHIFDSGYCVGMTLGATVAVTTVLEGPVDIHDNECKPLTQAVIRGYRLTNLTGTNCTGALCTYTMTNVKVHNNTFTGWSTSCADFTDEIGGNTGNPQVYDNDCITGNASVAGAGGLRAPFTTSGYCNSNFPLSTAATYPLYPFQTAINTDACGTIGTALQTMRSAVAAPMGVCTIAVNTGGPGATAAVTVTFNDVTKTTSATTTVGAGNNNNTPYTPVTLTGGIAIGDAYDITVTLGATEVAFATPRVMVNCW